MKKLKIEILKIATYLFILLFTLVFTSCSSDDDSSDGAADGDYKITITLNNVESENDMVNIAFSGSNQNLDTSSWSLNGDVQEGQIAFALFADDFSGSTSTYVAESNFELIGISGGVSVLNLNGENITGSIMIEKGGEVVVNEEINLENEENYIEQYNL